MKQRIARTLRYLATLAIDEQTAQTNAAEGSATLAERRQDQARVDEYLQGRLLTFPVGETKRAGRGGHGVEHRV